MTAPAKAKVATVKLEPGTDLVGTVKFISFYPEKDNPKEPGKKMSAQWALTGTWDGQEGRVYIDTYKLTTDLAPFFKEEGRWHDGSPKYKWTDPRSFRLHPYVKDKKHYVTVTPEVGQAEAVGHATTTTHTAGGDAEEESDDSKAVRKRWADLSDTYDACVKLAVKAWKEYGPFPMEELVRSADCLFIEANKRNLPPPPKREAQQ